MELELTRVDYAVVALTIPNCFKLLPNVGHKQQQKIAVGDQDGVLQLFSIKKEELQIHFKTLPGTKIASVQLGGAPGTMEDKIFIASENKVRGYNKKGKMFLSFDTNLTENIKTMFVSGADLIVCGNHVYNHYKDCKDNGSYLCGDTIVDVAALCPNNTNRIITVLACSGRVLRILEHCRVRQTIELESVPTVLHVPRGLGDKIICGFTDGKVVLFKIGHFQPEVKQEILVNDKASTSAVTCLDTCDLSGDGKDDLILGRRDGTVQIFTIKSEDNEIDLESHQLFKDNYNESISSVQGGCIGCNGYLEVIVCTYTGRIFGLTTQCIARSLSDNKNGANYNFPNDTNQRIAKLKAEILEMEQNVAKEREKYQISTQALSPGLSAIPMLTVNDTMTLCKDDASYNLSIEVPASIENVLLQSDVPIDLLDVEKNTAVVSFSECDPLSGNYVLATYRCQINTNRVDLKIRTIEGQHGTLQAYITPALQPKCCQLKKYIIQPLSLHMRIHSIDCSRPFSVLTLKGAFSLAEMHNWISYCIPEIPEKVPAGNKCTLEFFNVFVGTQLQCEYSKGEAIFKSDNVSTISILKDVLTKEITKKRIKLEISTNMNMNSIPKMLTLLEPQLKSHIKLSKQYKLLQSLIDLDIRNEEEKNALCLEYREILLNQKKIVADYKRDPIVLDRLYGLLTDLYIDWFKFKGVNVKSKIQQFVHLIDNYDYEAVVQFFGIKINENINLEDL